jgi:hypothetical protein
MRLSLHSLVLAPALLAAAALTPQPASAAVLHVPFAFTMSGQTMPAGQYTVARDNRGSFVTLTTPDGKQSFTWLIAAGEPDPGATGVVLRFDPTNAGYTLRSIQYNAMITPVLDKKSRQTEDRPAHVIRGE